jgi:SOS response regulatory protein OraA/RecX
VALKLLERKWKNFQFLEPRERQRKAIEFLVRRGFDYDIAKEVIKQIETIE